MEIEIPLHRETPASNSCVGESSMYISIFVAYIEQEPQRSQSGFCECEVVYHCWTEDKIDWLTNHFLLSVPSEMSLQRMSFGYFILTLVPFTLQLSGALVSSGAGAMLPHVQVEIPWQMEPS